MSKNNYEGSHPYVVNQFRYHTRSLMRHSAIHGVEVEDLEQELMLDYLSHKQAWWRAVRGAAPLCKAKYTKKRCP